MTEITTVVKTRWARTDGTGTGDWVDFRSCSCRYAFGDGIGRLYVTVGDCHLRDDDTVDMPNVLDEIAASEDPVPGLDPIDPAMVDPADETEPWCGEGDR